MGKKVVLCVDDSPTILYFEKMILGVRYKIISATNGRLGVEAALEHRPDLILMDIMMPEMDGMEALRTMKDHDEIKDIPVLMMTTKSDQDRVETCFKLGCSDFLNKPIDPTELKKKIEKYMG